MLAFLKSIKVHLQKMWHPKDQSWQDLHEESLPHYSSQQRPHFLVKRYYFFTTELGSWTISIFLYQKLYQSYRVPRYNKWKFDFTFSTDYQHLSSETFFKACGYMPNRTLISKFFKDFSCIQRKSTMQIIELLANCWINLLL